MSKDRKDSVCAICLDKIKPEDKATLDSCSHAYCFNCIKSWVIDCENSCPQCKKPINQIKKGLEVLKVPKKSLDFENLEFFFCQICRLQIVWEQFESDDADTGAALCDSCMDHGIHLACMTVGSRADYWEDDFWQCNMCDESDSDED